MEFKLLSVQEIVLLHDTAIAQYGGAPGLRDKTLLQGAIGRAVSRISYGAANPGSLAAIVEASVAVAAGIVSSHPFVDGNKRAGLLTLRALLNLNSVNFRPAAGETADAMVRLAAGEWSEEDFGKWVLRNSSSR